MGKLELQVIEHAVEQGIALGLIREEGSPITHPVVLVKKKNGKYRMCVNYK